MEGVHLDIDHTGLKCSGVSRVDCDVCNMACLGHPCYRTWPYDDQDITEMAHTAVSERVFTTPSLITWCIVVDFVSPVFRNVSDNDCVD